MSMIGNFRAVPDDEVDRLLADPNEIEDYLYEGETTPDGEIDVDKAWHGLHYLLTGTAWEGDSPLDFILAGGREIGDVDVGYGPARAFRNPELREITRALDPITPEALRERFDPQRMLELGIYPEIWDSDPREDDTLAYLLEYYGVLKDFLARGAARGDGLIVYLN